MNPKEQLAALLVELRGLAEKARAGTLTDEEAQTYDTKSSEARALKSRIDDAERRATEAAFIDEQDKHYNQGAGTQAANRLPAVQEGRVQEQRPETRALQTIGQRFLADPQMTEFRQRGMQGPSPGAVKVDSFWHRDTQYDPVLTQEQRAAGLVYSGALPSQLISPMTVPGMFGPDTPPFTVRSAFLNGTTDSNLIEFYRELAYTNAAAFVAEATTSSPTALGGTGVKPESGITWERAEAAVSTIATWIAVTNQLLQDAAQLRSVIEGRLLDFVATAEDTALLNGSGTPPAIRGLLNVTGVQALDQTYFTGAAVVGVGTSNENFDRIARGRRLVSEVGRATANFVMLAPADYEKIITYTDADRQYLAGGPFSNGAANNLWGMRTIVTEALAAGTAVVGDGRMAAVWDRMAAQVLVGFINDQFIRNMQTLLAEERLAFSVYRPSAFAIVDLV